LGEILGGGSDLQVAFPSSAVEKRATGYYSYGYNEYKADDKG